jgi:hypothetical protein
VRVTTLALERSLAAIDAGVSLASLALSTLAPLLGTYRDTVDPSGAALPLMPAAHKDDIFFKSVNNRLKY